MPDFIELNNLHYCVDFAISHSEPVSLKCILFDMQSLWLEQIPIATMVDRENKRLSGLISYNEALVHSTLLAEKAASYTLHPNTTGDDDEGGSLRKLTVKHYVAETPVTFEFILAPGTADELSKCVIVPLWRTVLLLDAKNRALVAQITQKDVEIEQYRAEGAVLKRTTVQTTKFDEQLFHERFPMRLPSRTGLDVQGLLRGNEHRESLMQSLQIVVESGVGRETSASTSSSIKRFPSPGRAKKRASKKWKHERVDVLCTKIKFPDFSSRGHNDD